MAGFSIRNRNPERNRIMANSQPAKSIRLGAIEAAIWENEGKNGPFYSVTVKRSYREGETWKDSVSFGERDCIALARIALEANAWIGTKLREALPEDEDRDETPSESPERDSRPERSPREEKGRGGRRRAA